MHYNDLLEDLEGEMRRVAAYLGVDPDEDAWPRLVEAATFGSMQKNADKIMPHADFGFEGGAQRFFYKGTNQRWKSVLTEEELALYPQALERTLSRDAASWLENGRGVDPPG